MATWRALKTPETRKIENLLRKQFPDYPPKHPPAAYRYNPASIRVRVVSNRFSGMTHLQSYDLVNAILEKHLPEETRGDIMLVLTFPPEEVGDSLANFEFEHPHPRPAKRPRRHRPGAHA
jgi:stress-induced morphogen